MLRGEKVVPLQGLSSASKAMDNIGQSNEAAQLFMTTARQHVPDLSFSPADQKQVSRICQIVEGVPLAIELAVQWVGTLPLSAIANELEAGLDALSTEILDLPIRHRSMQAVFNGSWRRLTDDAQAVLQKISVFQGGFTLEAAAAVAGAPHSTLAHLVNQSLLRFNHQEKRYHCHELLRQYAAAQFETKRDETRQARQKHLDYYGQLAARGGKALRGGGTKKWMARLKDEQRNFEIAFEWGYVNDLNQVARMAIDLHLFYFITGRMITGQQFYEKLLNKKAELSAPIEGWVLTWYTAMIWVQGRLEESQTLTEEAEKIFQNVNDETGITMSHHHRMVIAHYRGDLETAALHSDQAVAMARRIKKSAPWFLTVCLQGRATLLANLGQEEAAYRVSSECLQLSLETGNKMTATYAMANLARFAIRRGDFAQAHALSEQALAIAQDLNDRRMEGIQYLVLGNIDLAQRDFDTAVEHLEIALKIADQINNVDLLDEITMLLGDAYRGTGQYPLALHAFQRWGEISRQMNHQANMATCLEKIAITYWNLFPSNMKSLRWFAAAAAWQKNAAGGGQESINNRFLEMFRDEISPPEFARIWEAGQSLSLTEELAEAISVEAPAENAP
jgi:tetratricopeptide (TPR) repeat protein